MVSFDSNQGTFTIRRSDGTPLVTNGTTAVNFRTDTHPSTTGDFKHSVQSTEFSDQLGSGARLTVTSTDTNNRIKVELDLALYDQLPAIVLEVHCTNVSDQDVMIHGIEPLRVAAVAGGLLHAPGVSKCITNGQMYFDDGRIHSFGN